jgi:hypothetical protein
MAKSKVDAKALAGSMKSGGHRPGKPYYFITVRRKRDGKVVHVPIFTPPKGAGARRAAARHNARQRAQQTGQTPAERNAKAGRLRSMREAGQALRSDPRATAAAAAIVPGQRAAKQAGTKPTPTMPIGTARPGGANIVAARADTVKVRKAMAARARAEYRDVISPDRAEWTQTLRTRRSNELQEKVPHANDAIVAAGRAARAKAQAIIEKRRAGSLVLDASGGRVRTFEESGGIPIGRRTSIDLATERRSKRKWEPPNMARDMLNVKEWSRSDVNFMEKQIASKRHRLTDSELSSAKEQVREWKRISAAKPFPKGQAPKPARTPKPASSRPPAADRAARVLAKIESRAPRARYELGTLQARTERVMSKLPAKDKQAVAGGTSGKQATQRAKDRVAESWEGARRLDFDRTGDYPGASKPASPSLREQAAKRRVGSMTPEQRNAAAQIVRGIRRGDERMIEGAARMTGLPRDQQPKAVRRALGQQIKRARAAVRNPPAIQGSSDRQVAYAADVRRRGVENALAPARADEHGTRADIRRESGPRGEAQYLLAARRALGNQLKKSKGVRYAALARAGKIAGRNRARDILG